MFMTIKIKLEIKLFDHRNETFMLMLLVWHGV